MLFNYCLPSGSSSSSGGGITIQSGASLPVTVSPNTVFIIPVVDITDYHIGYDEPLVYDEGSIWLKTDYIDNCTVTYASSESPYYNFGLFQVYQYTSGSWSSLNGWYGTETEWVQFSAEPLVVTYSGDYTDTEITGTDGETYRLLTLTSSGTLGMSKGTQADIWICGGGSNGSSTYGYDGGGAGAYTAESREVPLSGVYVVTIGSGSGTSSFSDILSANGVQNSCNGGTGGGRGKDSGGTGDGVAKYPFSDSTNFYCHCAGGGAGGYVNSPDYEGYDGTTYAYQGGAGGSNGGGGSGRTNEYFDNGDPGSRNGGAGGNYGGGTGGKGGTYGYNASSATFYGSGGGQRGEYRWGTTWGGETNYIGNHGSGYQGVCYIRIKQ